MDVIADVAKATLYNIKAWNFIFDFIGKGPFHFEQGTSNRNFWRGHQDHD